ncbi:peptidoglycan-associated lipoprotein [Geomonas silvestris]|uniref:Peptidoglycan-associated lipoprotein n=1 Tax=Geomonas silvestris TaxID=2740184 RepID=A0A6V8MHH1_9BACT|nr:peptidoglycan-associated lipoprotein Pal [Geomonas silvestris]GFO59425.1 peptidoglycan-associated lipoprotein [Geomonas silvestris]
MNWKAVGVLWAVSGWLLMAGGCAKNQTVKKDEGIAPAAAAAAPAPTAPSAQAKPASASQNQPVQQPAAAQEQPAPTQSDRAATLKQGLHRIYFNFDSANLSDQARSTLVGNAELLKEINSGKIRVEGNCDERGSDDYNLALGEQRAKEAAKYLTSLGIPAERLSVISYGKEKPLAQGHDEASWSKNRRDDFVVVP